MKTTWSERGFTLVEIVVVLAMIGIIAAIAIPSFRGAMPKVRLNNATQTLSNSIAMARMAAIAKSTTFAVQFDASAASFSLFQYTDDPSTSATDYAWRLTGKTGLGGTVGIESVTYADATTVLPPSPALPGLPPLLPTLLLNANGTTDVPFQKLSLRIMLKTTDGDLLRRRVVVASTGRIFSQKWAGGSVDDDAAWIED